MEFSLKMKSLDHKRAADILKTFAHPTRLKIIEELLKGPKCVNDIEELVCKGQANVSQHLSILRLSRIVDCEQNGSKKCYFLKEPELAESILNAIKGRKGV